MLVRSSCFVCLFFRWRRRLCDGAPEQPRGRRPLRRRLRPTGAASRRRKRCVGVRRWSSIPARIRWNTGTTASRSSVSTPLQVNLDSPLATFTFRPRIPRIGRIILKQFIHEVSIFIHQFRLATMSDLFPRPFYSSTVLNYRLSLTTLLLALCNQVKQVTHGLQSFILTYQ